MKKNILNLLIILFLCLILICILIFSNDVLQTVLFAFTIWKENIFTSLFPIFITTDLLINYGFIELIGEASKKIMNRLFYLPGEASFVIIGSMLSGFPSSAKYIKELLDKKFITESEGQYLLSFTHFSNPLFVIGVIGNLLNNKSLGFLILLVHISVNFLIAFLIRKKESITNTKINMKSAFKSIEKRRKENSFIKVLTSSIMKTINTLLLLLGIITTFLVLSKIVNNIINLNTIYQSFINGILEMTQGIKYVSMLSIPLNIKASIITFFISFGGISIHLQITSILSDANIKYKYYLFSRIIHATISSILIYFIVTKFY